MNQIQCRSSAERDVWVLHCMENDGTMAPLYSWYSYGLHSGYYILSRSVSVRQSVIYNEHN